MIVDNESTEMSEYNKIYMETGKSQNQKQLIKKHFHDNIKVILEVNNEKSFHLLLSPFAFIAIRMSTGAEGKIVLCIYFVCG